MVRKNDNEKIILIIKLIGIIFFVPRGTFLLYIKKNGRVGVYSLANFHLQPLTWFPFHVSVYEWFIIRLHRIRIYFSKQNLIWQRSTN